MTELLLCPGRCASFKEGHLFCRPRPSCLPPNTTPELPSIRLLGTSPWTNPKDTVHESSQTLWPHSCFCQVKLISLLWGGWEIIPASQGQTWKYPARVWRCFPSDSISRRDDGKPGALPTSHPSARLPGGAGRVLPSFLMTEPSSCPECI